MYNERLGSNRFISVCSFVLLFGLFSFQLSAGLLRQSLRVANLLQGPAPIVVRSIQNIQESVKDVSYFYTTSTEDTLHLVSYHEAAHTIAAIHYGFPVTQVEVHKVGRPFKPSEEIYLGSTMLDIEEMLKNDVDAAFCKKMMCVFLAGGVATEYYLEKKPGISDDMKKFKTFVTLLMMHSSSSSVAVAYGMKFVTDQVSSLTDIAIVGIPTNMLINLLYMTEADFYFHYKDYLEECKNDVLAILQEHEEVFLSLATALEEREEPKVLDADEVKSILSEDESFDIQEESS